MALGGVPLVLSLACTASRDRVAPKATPPPFLESHALRDHALVKRGSEVRAVVPAPCPSDREYPLEGARRVEIAFGAVGSASETRARFRALFKTVDGQETVALDENVTFAAGADTTWLSRELTVPESARSLRLATQGTAQTSFWRPVLSRRGSAPARSVVLISLDTVRADHLNAYGYKRRPTSPELEAWAAQGTLFSNAMAPAPGTFSSQMALLTGKYPSNHGVTYANWRRSGQMPVLAPEVPTLAELLRERGFLTAAFTGSGYFALPVGYSRGFSEFVASDDETRGSAATVFGKAMAWMEGHAEDSFFLFLHTYEAHAPYLDDRFVREEKLGQSPWSIRNEALYDGDIRRADESLGKLRLRLKDLSLTDRTLVVIVSDHGEEFGDHFEIWSEGHGHSLYEEQVHVPFVVVGPSVRPGRRLAPAVDLTSVAPTVLAFLEVSPPAPLDGRDLLGRLRGEPFAADDAEGLAFSEDVWIGPRTWSARTRDWKLVVQAEDLEEKFLDTRRRRAIRAAVGRLDREMLFHLPSDRGERENRLARGEAQGSRLRARLDAHVAGMARRGGDRLGGAAALEGEVTERLRALGYVE